LGKGGKGEMLEGKGERKGEGREGRSLPYQ